MSGSILLPPGLITIGARHRKDLGDLSGLIESIRMVGLLQPIVCTPNYKLLAGRRRLEAAIKLKMIEVPVFVVEGLDQLGELMAERDENVNRLDFTPSEKAAIYKEILEYESAAAAGRKKATQAKPGNDGKRPAATTPTGGVKLTPPVSPKKTEAKAAAAAKVGMSRNTAEKAAEVVAAAEEDPANADLVDQMDATGKVDPAHRELTRRRKKEPEQPKAEEMVDQVGNVVPPHLRDVFGDPWIKKGRSLVLTAQDAYHRVRPIRQQLSGKGVEYPFMLCGQIDEHVAQIDALFELIISKLDNGEPYAVCPACKGKAKGCAECRRSGYVPEFKYREMTTGVA